MRLFCIANRLVIITYLSTSLANNNINIDDEESENDHEIVIPEATLEDAIFDEQIDSLSLGFEEITAEGHELGGLIQHQINEADQLYNSLDNQEVNIRRIKQNIEKM